ncbi:hypothetical protein EMCRGX_G005654 [Ephydatia muelleri]
MPRSRKKETLFKCNCKRSPDSCNDQALEVTSNQAYETERLEYTELDPESDSAPCDEKSMQVDGECSNHSDMEVKKALFVCKLLLVEKV